MAKFCGGLFILKIAHPSTPDTWLDLGGLESNDLNSSQEYVDVTSKGSGGVREGKPECSISQFSLSGNGFVTDEAGFLELISKHNAKLAATMQITSESGEEWEGPFHITNLVRAGPLGEAETFTVSFENTAALTYTAAP